MNEIEEYPPMEEGSADVVRLTNASFSWGKSASKEDEAGGCQHHFSSTFKFSFSLCLSCKWVYIDQGLTPCFIWLSVRLKSAHVS